MPRLVNKHIYGLTYVLRLPYDFNYIFFRKGGFRVVPGSLWCKKRHEYEPNRPMTQIYPGSIGFRVDLISNQNELESIETTEYPIASH